MSGGARYQLIYQTMRELARREPTFALHVHIGVPDAESAIVMLNRLRAHVPLLLALSANSPFWQGRDTGLASARTPIFQAFPRTGIPREFGSYADYVETVDRLLRCDAFPEPSFLWWDLRPRPRFGTIELRVMDAQTTAERSVALTALVQALAHLELRGRPRRSAAALLARAARREPVPGRARRDRRAAARSRERDASAGPRTAQRAARCGGSARSGARLRARAGAGGGDRPRRRR